MSCSLYKKQLPCSYELDLTSLGICDMGGNTREIVIHNNKPLSICGSYYTHFGETLKTNQHQISEDHTELEIGFRCIKSR